VGVVGGVWRVSGAILLLLAASASADDGGSGWIPLEHAGIGSQY